MPKKPNKRMTANEKNILQLVVEAIEEVKDKQEKISRQFFELELKLAKNIADATLKEEKDLSDMRLNQEKEQTRLRLI